MVKENSKNDCLTMGREGNQQTEGGNNRRLSHSTGRKGTLASSGIRKFTPLRHLGGSQGQAFHPTGKHFQNAWASGEPILIFAALGEVCANCLTGNPYLESFPHSICC